MPRAFQPPLILVRLEGKLLESFSFPSQSLIFQHFCDFHDSEEINMLLNLPGCAPGPNKVGFLHLRLIIALLRKHKENTVSLLLSKLNPEDRR